MEQRTPEWFEARKLRLTGSRIGAILGLSPWQSPDDIIRQMVREHHGAETEFKGNPATDHGNNNEQRALLAFMRTTGLLVEECGFLPYGDRMGASPDGLTSDGGTLELKVPFGLRNDKEGNFKPLHEQPHYECQTQMEMLAAERNHAYFAQYIAPKGDPLDVDYVPEQINIERVELDPNWLDKHMPQLDAFYTRLMAELDNPEHLEPLRAEIDTPEAGALLSEIDTIRARKKADEKREKEIIKELSVIADGKSALIHGRKFTLVKGRKSVAYKKAIDALLPDADLSDYETVGKESWRLT